MVDLHAENDGREVSKRGSGNVRQSSVAEDNAGNDLRVHAMVTAPMIAVRLQARLLPRSQARLCGGAVTIPVADDQIRAQVRRRAAVDVSSAIDLPNDRVSVWPLPRNQLASQAFCESVSFIDRHTAEALTTFRVEIHAVEPDRVRLAGSPLNGL